MISPGPSSSASKPTVSTDAGNIEDELFLVLYFDYHSTKGKVRMVNSFFAVRQLQRGAGQGLFECLRSAVEYMGVTGWESKLVGFGCDGTNANIGERGGTFEGSCTMGGSVLYD